MRQAGGWVANRRCCGAGARWRRGGCRLRRDAGGWRLRGRARGRARGLDRASPCPPAGGRDAAARPCRVDRDRGRVRSHLERRGAAGGSLEGGRATASMALLEKWNQISIILDAQLIRVRGNLCWGGDECGFEVRNRVELRDVGEVVEDWRPELRGRAEQGARRQWAQAARGGRGRTEMRWKLQLTAPTDGMQSLDGRSKWGSQVGGGSRGSRSVLDGNIQGDGKFAVVLVGGASSGRGRTQSRVQTAKGRSLSQPAPDSDKRQKLGRAGVCVAAGSFAWH